MLVQMLLALLLGSYGNPRRARGVRVAPRLVDAEKNRFSPRLPDHPPSPSVYRDYRSRRRHGGREEERRPTDGAARTVSFSGVSPPLTFSSPRNRRRVFFFLSSSSGKPLGDSAGDFA